MAGTDQQLAQIAEVQKKSIPMSSVRSVSEDEVHLNVGESVLENLREYQEA